MLKPANLAPAAWQQVESSGSATAETAAAYMERPFLGRVLVAWGDARWYVPQPHSRLLTLIFHTNHYHIIGIITRRSRTQLLGEIARGHWGLGKASVCELTAAPSQRWSGLDDRLCFSPVTEMTVRCPALRTSLPCFHLCSCVTHPSESIRIGVIDGGTDDCPFTQEDFMRSAQRQMDKERQTAEREGEVGHAGDGDDEGDDTASEIGGLTPRGSPS
jgi:hypothetical protein